MNLTEENTSFTVEQKKTELNEKSIKCVTQYDPLNKNLMRDDLVVVGVQVASEGPHLQDRQVPRILGEDHQAERSFSTFVIFHQLFLLPFWLLV